MKLTKSDLKSIVKECLLEILSEGIGATAVNESTARKQTPQQRVRPTHLDQQRVIPQQQKRQPVPAQAMREAVTVAAGGNSTMAAIFADTASTTLQKMIENDRPGAQPSASGVVERIVESSTPDQLFGEDTMNTWAALAFAEPKKLA